METPRRTHAATTAPGALIGEYRIERLLGEGAMGAVYAAVHSVIDKRAALKVLRRELCAKPEFIQRFIAEARAVNRIGHPNIIDVFGFGTTSDGRVFLAMELLEGQSLGKRIASGPLALDEACDIGIEITYALEAAHAAGIVHRDLKPDNVFLTRSRGRQAVKLLDFGIAKLSGDAALTTAGALLGTPTYIAPEQASGEQVDGRADIYALGVILFEMLVGRPPFQAPSSVVLASMHISESPPVPSSLNPELPAAADQLLATMLDKAPARRPSLAEIRDRLERLRVEIGAGASGIFKPAAIPRDDSDLDDAAATIASMPAMPAAREPSRWSFFVLGVLMLALGFGAVVLLWPYLS